MRHFQRVYGWSYGRHGRHGYRRGVVASETYRSPSSLDVRACCCRCRHLHCPRAAVLYCWSHHRHPTTNPERGCWAGPLRCVVVLWWGMRGGGAGAAFACKGTTQSEKAQEAEKRRSKRRRRGRQVFFGCLRLAVLLQRRKVTTHRRVCERVKHMGSSGSWLVAMVAGASKQASKRITLHSYIVSGLALDHSLVPACRRGVAVVLPHSCRRQSFCKSGASVIHMYRVRQQQHRN